jgi:HEAT repeat protein
MPSIFEPVRFGDPAAAVFDALTATIVGIFCLIAFILARRAIRSRYFAHRDRRSQYMREHWDAIVSGEIPAATWFFDPVDQQLVEGIVLDRMEVAEPEELGRLVAFVRRSGLLDKRIREVRLVRGWRRRQALLALGQMRCSESIPALAEALRDADDRLAVELVHALGQVGTPRAAEAILERFAQRPTGCPEQVLKTALLSCYREDPQALFARALEADDSMRPVLARVLADVAQPGMSGDPLVLVTDPLAEVRASAARLLAATRPEYALLPLTRLAADKEWFVRLRAVVALGDLEERRGIPALIRALCDTNHLVRLRAAASLVKFDGQEAQVLELAMRTRDKYALQALVSEMDRSGRITDLVDRLADDEERAAAEPALVAALEGGATQMLADLLLHHPNRRVRARLARLMAASPAAGLLELLEELEAVLAAPGERRVLRFVISRLRRAPSEGELASTVAAV